jgi:hypothetical protein
MVTKVPYTAKGHAGAVDSVFVRNFWLDVGGQPTFENHVVAAGQVLEAGSIMGMEDTNQTLIFSVPTAADGSEQVFGILMEDLDTSATGINADAEVGILTFSNRMINFNALVYDAAWAPKALRKQLKMSGFNTRTPIYSGKI